MAGPLDGQVAVVTGGNRGIGRGIAAALAGDGATVVVTARERQAADTAAAELREAGGGDVRGVALDVTDADGVTGAVKAITADCGTISVLVNNAGIARDALLMRLKPHDWDAVVETNLTGVYRMCRAVVPTMVRARYGRIVNITSVVAALGNPGQASYTAAKAGCEGFTRSLARELASRNITVNCVAPGFIDTDMTRALDESARERLLDQVPLGRLGEASDVAGAVRFLVGEDAKYITGITLDVNGGMHMK